MAEQARATVAIDFGTTNSGAAYCLAGDDNKTVRTLEFPGLSNIKVPTSVVVERSPPHRGVGFGPDAIEQFEEDDHAIFHRFKMQLYEDPNATTIKADVGGLTIGTETVIARCLEMLKDKVLRQIEEMHGLDVTPKEVRWVLTVPAIWEEASKAVMRRAAHQAGLIEEETSDQLVLALEPECAALDCHESLDKGLLATGTRYLVVDCGGGTVDTAAFEAGKGLPNLQLHAVLPPRGGHWGSTRIDAKFLEFLRELLDDPACLRGNTFAVFDLLTSVWEDRKVSFGTGMLANPNARVSINLNPVLQEMHNPPRLRDAVERYSARHPTAKLKAIGAAQLRIPATLMKTFYDDVLSDISKHVRKLLREMGRADYVLLVGGFGGSSLVQDAVREQAEAAGARLLIPPKPWASIVIGAVHFGLTPAAIASRRAAYTYGVGMDTPVVSFIMQHGVPEDNRVYLDTERETAFVRGVFHHFVSANQSQPIEAVVQHTYAPPDSKSVNVAVRILASRDPSVVYADADGVHVLGVLSVSVSSGGPVSDKQIKVCMQFGATELMVFVESSTTGDKKRMCLDFGSQS